MKNFYLILQVDPGATQEQIRKAYKRLARRYHPDAGGGDAERFKEICDAYEVLMDPGRRREHNRALKMDREPSPSIMSGAPVDMGLDFAVHLPSFENLMDFLLGRFQGRAAPRSGGKEHLHVEIILSPREAAEGGVLPLEVPVLTECPRCEGGGRIGGFVCGLCDGTGGVESRRTLNVNIPPGVRDRTSFEYDLAVIDVPGAVLHVDVRTR